MRTLLVTLGVVGVLSMVGAAPAHACGNGVEHRVDPRVATLLSAENALRAGDYRRAAKLAQRHHPDLRHADDSGSHAARAARVMALAIVRSGGEWWAGRQAAPVRTAERAEHLEWAVSKLRRHAMRSLNHPGRLSELGEALATVEKYQDEARRILEHLAARDIVTSAHAYAALARLRAAAGDDQGASRAFNLCRKLERKSPICSAVSGPKA